MSGAGALSRRSVLGAGAALGAGLALPAWAQGSYPDRPIKLVVPFPPGALTDTLGRLVADRLRPALNQPLVVENRPGAGTLLGASVVAKSPPDGYSLMVATSTTLAISPAMYAAPPAVPSDFTGVAMIGSVSLFLVTRADLKVASVAELVAEMRRNGQMNFGSPGIGTMHHLLVEMIKAQEKVNATHVPYQGSMAAVSDLLTGRIDFMFLDAVAALPQLQAGKLNAIGLAAGRRLAALPQVPTIAETFPAIDLQAWQTVAAPRGTPTAIVQRLNTEINKALDSPEGRAALLKVGVDANPLGVQALNDLIARDEKRLGDLVRAAGLKAS
ncbi:MULTISPECIES: Bug family tripartite tricarboxylate transporter substrate binding protein [Ramlibacter]|uniref:Tripartite tricarboxylate transporter substrate binding protein n=1 Tax=Ramlibacter pinisoli TaxID=2682844 RepID=A0A6N8IQQ1_9BURK|nr:MULTISPECIES: tripartite tricarboxylate transporter substrate binding protein [Ramlibacter]MBA2964211.1 tripartite tricarboxylate transporter substrate binding protein [Ramlibacter sp. CGMCC 1.13660]MVQ29177.1 tripartite tricarboxylate transporter substrate binding protein [Ramlibacter pinisoli]